MKQIKRILALAFVVLLVFATVSCGGVSGKKFARGTIDGNVYTSEFLGLTFTKPADWIYYSDAEIAQLMGATASYLDDPESFEKAAEGSVIDFYAQAENGDNVNITFAKGGPLTNLDTSVEVNVKLMKDQYTAMGLSVEATSPADVKLGKLDCKVVTLTVKTTGVSMTQYCYFAMEGRYLVCIACTDVTGLGETQFRNMFS